MALTSTTTFATAADGAQLAAHLNGVGPSLLCLPGGPLLDSSYLGDLGGLSAYHQLVLADPRGTGASDPVDDPAAWRCDRLIADVDAQCRHLGPGKINILAHSAGANLAYRYAEHHPDRMGRLVLVTPSVVALSIDIPADTRRETAELRRDEPWYPEAASALATILNGTPTEATWAAITPFAYGRWDQTAQAHAAGVAAGRDPEAAEAFVAEGAFDPLVTRAALAALDVPVLVIAGSLDVGNPPRIMAEVADIFLNGRLAVQPGAGHFPWLDDPAWFCQSVSSFLAE